MSTNYDRNEVSGCRRRGAGYDKRFIKKIVLAIEKGLPRSEAIRGAIRLRIKEMLEIRFWRANLHYPHFRILIV